MSVKISPTEESFRQKVLARMDYWMSPWCKCICREYPDGTMCKLCGHAHEIKAQ